MINQYHSFLFSSRVIVSLRVIYNFRCYRIPASGDAINFMARAGTTEGKELSIKEPLKAPSADKTGLANKPGLSSLPSKQLSKGESLRQNIQDKNTSNGNQYAGHNAKLSPLPLKPKPTENKGISVQDIRDANDKLAMAGTALKIGGVLASETGIGVMAIKIGSRMTSVADVIDMSLDAYEGNISSLGYKFPLFFISEMHGGLINRMDVKNSAKIWLRVGNDVTMDGIKSMIQTQEKK